MKTTRYTLLEITKPANMIGAGSRLPLGDQPQLRVMDGRQVQILAIEAFSVESFPVAPSGLAVSNEAAFKNALLVLQVGGTEYVQVPLPRLSIMHVEADTVPYTDLLFEFQNFSNVNWATSYIQFAAAPAAAEFSYLFGIYYSLLGERV